MLSSLTGISYFNKNTDFFTIVLEMVSAIESSSKYVNRNVSIATALKSRDARVDAITFSDPITTAAGHKPSLVINVIRHMQSFVKKKPGERSELPKNI